MEDDQKFIAFDFCFTNLCISGATQRRGRLFASDSSMFWTVLGQFLQKKQKCKF